MLIPQQPTPLQFYRIRTCIHLFKSVVRVLSSSLSLLSMAGVRNETLDIWVLCIKHRAIHWTCVKSFFWLYMTDSWYALPFPDIILTVSLVVICIAGMVFQYYRERGHRPFPPCPYQEYKWRRANPPTLTRTYNAEPTRPAPRQATNQPEHDPLLQNRSSDPTHYEVISPGQGIRSPARYGSMGNQRIPANSPRPINDVSGFYENSEDADENRGNVNPI